ncbi:hypothetical protein ACLKA7_007467 [Drosophila subpalustris]
MPENIKEGTILVDLQGTKEGPIQEDMPENVNEGTTLKDMPENVKEGAILAATAKGQWRIGPSIGMGGLEENPSARRKIDKNYEAVVKCEPRGYGSLFAEMCFYLRNAKLDDLKLFKMMHGLKLLGMPCRQWQSKELWKSWKFS